MISTTKHFFVFVIIFIVKINSIYAQNLNDKQEFIGTLQTIEGKFISYKLIFTKDPSGTITGKSITDFFGKNCTESTIVGKINAHSISFQETKNINTQSKADPNIFCYVHANNLKFEQFKDKYYLKGNFNAKYNNGIACANGKIYLASAALLEDVKSNLNNKEDRDSLKKEIANLKNTLLEHTNLTANKTLDIKTTEKSLKLIVWDSYLEDNDQIDIYVNGKILLNNIEIKQERKIIEIETSSPITEIKIVAVNEGSSAKNTLNGILENGNEQIPFISKLKKGEFVYIKVKK